MESPNGFFVMVVTTMAAGGNFAQQVSYTTTLLQLLTFQKNVHLNILATKRAEQASDNRQMNP